MSYVCWSTKIEIVIKEQRESETVEKREEKKKKRKER
jgi:hypothetical protein